MPNFRNCDKCDDRFVDEFTINPELCMRCWSIRDIGAPNYIPEEQLEKYYLLKSRKLYMNGGEKE